MSIASRIGKTLAPSVPHLAPSLTSAFVHEALDRAINGVGPQKVSRYGEDLLGLLA